MPGFSRSATLKKLSVCDDNEDDDDDDEGDDDDPLSVGSFAKLGDGGANGGVGDNGGGCEAAKTLPIVAQKLVWLVGENWNYFLLGVK